MGPAKNFPKTPLCCCHPGVTTAMQIDLPHYPNFHFLAPGSLTHPKPSLLAGAHVNSQNLKLSGSRGPCLATASPSSHREMPTGFLQSLLLLNISPLFFPNIPHRTLLSIIPGLKTNRIFSRFKKKMSFFPPTPPTSFTASLKPERKDRVLGSAPLPPSAPSN